MSNRACSRLAGRRSNVFASEAKAPRTGQERRANFRGRFRSSAAFFLDERMNRTASWPALSPALSSSSTLSEHKASVWPYNVSRWPRWKPAPASLKAAAVSPVAETRDPTAASNVSHTCTRQYPREPYVQRRLLASPTYPHICTRQDHREPCGRRRLYPWLAHRRHRRFRPPASLVSDANQARSQSHSANW